MCFNVGTTGCRLVTDTLVFCDKGASVELRSSCEHILRKMQFNRDHNV